TNADQRASSAARRSGVFSAGGASARDVPEIAAGPRIKASPIHANGRGLIVVSLGSAPRRRIPRRAEKGHEEAAEDSMRRRGLAEDAGRAEPIRAPPPAIAE